MEAAPLATLKRVLPTTYFFGDLEEFMMDTPDEIMNSAFFKYKLEEVASYNGSVAVVLWPHPQNPVLLVTTPEHAETMIKAQAVFNDLGQAVYQSATTPEDFVKGLNEFGKAVNFFEDGDCFGVYIGPGCTSDEDGMVDIDNTGSVTEYELDLEDHPFPGAKFMHDSSKLFGEQWYLPRARLIGDVTPG